MVHKRGGNSMEMYKIQSPATTVGRGHKNTPSRAHRVRRWFAEPQSRYTSVCIYHVSLVSRVPNISSRPCVRVAPRTGRLETGGFHGPRPHHLRPWITDPPRLSHHRYAVHQKFLPSRQRSKETCQKSLSTTLVVRGSWLSGRPQVRNGQWLHGAFFCNAETCQFLPAQ